MIVTGGSVGLAEGIIDYTLSCVFCKSVAYVISDENCFNTKSTETI